MAAAALIAASRSVFACSAASSADAAFAQACSSICLSPADALAAAFQKEWASARAWARLSCLSSLGSTTPLDPKLMLGSRLWAVGTRITVTGSVSFSPVRGLVRISEEQSEAPGFNARPRTRSRTLKRSTANNRCASLTSTSVVASPRRFVTLVLLWRFSRTVRMVDFSSFLVMAFAESANESSSSVACARPFFLKNS